MFFRRQLRAEPPAALFVAAPIETLANDTDILARTIWGEARGEPLSGKEAVAQVVLNRLRLAKRRGAFWWGNDLQDICLKPFQFSCWNKDDPNCAKTHAVNTQDAQFAICLRIARRALNGVLPDATKGADHYHNTSITPHWAEGRVPTTQIGRHLFYKLEN